MKRVLWVTAIPPCFDAGGGGEIRQAHLLDGLADRFDVDLLLAGRLDDERVRDRLHSVQEVSVDPYVDPTGSIRRRLRDVRWQVVERRPDEVARQRRVRKALTPYLVAGGAPEIVCVEYIGLAPLVPTRRRGFWVLTLHNLTSEMARHSASIAPGHRQRIMRTLEARNARRLERSAIRAYDLVVSPSPEDAARLSSDVVVVPNGVDIRRFKPSPPASAPRVVFTGALHTLPNRDGIVWFCQRVWPSIRREVGDAVLEIVGARPPEEVRALSRIEGVTVHADVPDVVPFLEHSRVAVVPVRIGTGSRLKALEAMAAGRPVAGTTIGLGGLDVRPGHDVLIADEADALASAVVRCLRDSELTAALGARGRAIVEERYGWSRIAADYASLLDERTSSQSNESELLGLARA